jgi:integrase
MANKTVTLIRLCKTPTGWRRLPIVVGKNGRIRPGYALMNGEPVEFLDGHYELRTYEGNKTVYRNVGENAADALAAQQKESHLLAAKGSADLAGIDIPVGIVIRHSLLRKKTEFLDRHIAQGQVAAAKAANVAIDNFLIATKHTTSDQITGDSVIAFYRYLRKEGNQDRTIFNKHTHLFVWFKWLGLDLKKLADKKPSYTAKEVSVYHADDLQVFFSHCNKYNNAVFKTLLMTGLRMQEAMNLEWTKVDFRSKVMRVREITKEKLPKALGYKIPGVRIKDREERTVPIPDELIDILKSWREQRPKSRLVLGTRNDAPNAKWLMALKRIARKAGLNCGRCAGCRTYKECHLWFVHKFRATYTTSLLLGGTDIRTVMSFTGHSNMETVMRYLSPAKASSMQQKVSAMRWGQVD